MILEGVVLLAGFTPRSQSYVQAMVNMNFQPEHTVLFGPEKPILPGQAMNVSKTNVDCDIFFPDISIPIRQTISDNKWDVSFLSSENINDDVIAVRLAELVPALVIYSGYGGQIVKSSLFDMGFPILHLHSGWLPDYRGSTTLYYSWLNDGYIGVSAILLRAGIDLGPILKRKKYPIPPRDVSLDYVYDCAVRADLMVEIIKEYIQNGSLPESIEQNDVDGTTYYVIHPILKHLVLLSREDSK